MKIAIVPGSFDPMTRGHVDIVKRAAEEFDKVYVAVMINRDKRYLFGIDERKIIAERSCADINNVEVISDEGMLYMLYERLGASAVVKGIRNETDRTYEENMAEYNRKMNPDFNTVLLECNKSYEDLSSTIVRERLLSGESCALITDAGMPAISDPGEDIVRLCAEAAITVTVIPVFTYSKNSSPKMSTTGIFTSGSQTDAKMEPAAAKESIGLENSIHAG